MRSTRFSRSRFSPGVSVRALEIVHFHKSQLRIKLGLKLPRDIVQHRDAAMIDQYRDEIPDRLYRSNLLGDPIQHGAFLLRQHRRRLPHPAQIIAFLHRFDNRLQLAAGDVRINLVLENDVDQSAGVTAGNSGHSLSAVLSELIRKLANQGVVGRVINTNLFPCQVNRQRSRIAL